MAFAFHLCCYKCRSSCVEEASLGEGGARGEREKGGKTTRVGVERARLFNQSNTRSSQCEQDIRLYVPSFSSELKMFLWASLDTLQPFNRRDLHPY